MNAKDFDVFVKGLEELEEAILCSKGPDYSRGDADRLSNFKTIGAELVPMLKAVFERAIPGVKLVADDPADQAKLDDIVGHMNYTMVPEFDEGVLQKIGTMICWWVYFRKHIDALANYVRSGKVESEGLVGRINDARNYLALGAGLMADFGDLKLPEVK